VKLSVEPRSDAEMLCDFPRRTRAADWFLRVSEVSNGHWLVIARDRWGREVSRSGGDADVERMVQECEDYAVATAGRVSDGLGPRTKSEPVTEPPIRIGGLVEETGVCLAVYAEDLEPDAVSALLGCSPTSSHHKGDRRGPRSPPQKRGGWFLDVRGKAPQGPEELTEALLKQLPDDEHVWVKLAEHYEVQLRFGIHMNGWNRGFGFSAGLAAKVARLHAELVFDGYAYDDEETAPPGQQ
jgi:hypothetical protein